MIAVSELLLCFVTILWFVLQDSMVVLDSQWLPRQHSSSDTPSALHGLLSVSCSSSGWVLGPFKYTRLRGHLGGAGNTRRWLFVIDCHQCLTVSIVDHVLKGGLPVLRKRATCKRARLAEATFGCALLTTAKVSRRI